MRIVERVVGDELGWVFRPEARRDFGIDGLIEVVNDHAEATGRLIAVQIKSGPSYFGERDSYGFVYRGESKHLNYWLGHSLPVIVILCDPSTEACFYTEINAANTRPTNRGWAATVPDYKQFSKNAKEALLRLAAGPQRGDLIELSLMRHLIERWGDRLKIVTIIDSPRDFHRFPLLIDISGDTGGYFGVQFIDTALEPFTVGALEQEIEWREYNARSASVSDLMLFVVGDDAASTEPSPEVAEFLAEQERLRWYRVVYGGPGRGLDEIDESGKVVWYMPGDDEPFNS